MQWLGVVFVLFIFNGEEDRGLFNVETFEGLFLENIVQVVFVIVSIQLNIEFMYANY